MDALRFGPKLGLPMALASPPATTEPAELRLPWDLRLTPEQFERVCQANPDAVLELAADGTLTGPGALGVQVERPCPVADWEETTAGG